jgi:uncharacterized protein YcnI
MRLLPLVAVVVFAASASALQPDPDASVTVGNGSARRGQAFQGALKVPLGVDSATTIPVAVINGIRPGTVLAWIAGSHGAEYTSIVALTQIIERKH